MIGSNDPYYLVEKDVKSSIKELQITFIHWKSLLINTNTSTNKEFKWYNKEIKRALLNLEQDICDIKQVIQTIELNPTKFPFPKSELNNRKLFVRDTQLKIEDIKKELSSDKTIFKINQDKQNIKMTTTTFGDSIKKQHETDNYEFVNEQTKYKQSLMNKQDQGLDELENNLKILHEQGICLNSSLKEQSVILDTLNDRTTNSTNSINSIMRKLDRFMETWK